MQATRIDHELPQRSYFRTADVVRGGLVSRRDFALVHNHSLFIVTCQFSGPTLKLTCIQEHARSATVSDIEPSIRLSLTTYISFQIP
jgi:hypothetical protein